MTNDHIIATKIVDLLFKHINMCIKLDRSKVKLNPFEKGIISGMLSDKTAKGINNYILNMYPSDIKILMNDIESEIKKRSS